ncbi:Selenoprotein P, N terminal region [Nesidiocoris tenuis]|uniref:Selenoprotein P, N terminal region n=1 Tax=Nesidiocoris tenuis TaxID=355587 RepID=A0ABN7B7I4_9HEMI|nr:Selenoprotein P, N terminal region [Nesidiocoris tenuis]
MTILWWFFGLAISGVLGFQVEHCNVVNETIVKKGVVNLVYSMERQCIACYNEANNLVTLCSQFAKFGINVNVFIAINELSASQIGAKLPERFEINVGQIWNNLGAKNGHIFVLDSCGRIAYQVIMPWSKQIYPFTAMSVLSAIFDKPCGECNVSTPIHSRLINLNSFRRDESDEENDENLENTLVKDSPIPLTIVYREKHYHLQGDRQVEYNLVELRSNDPQYHGHGDDTAAQEAGDDSAAENSTEMTTARTQQYPTAPWVKPADNITYQNGDFDDKGNDMKNMDEDETKKLMKHYKPMMKWLNCAKYVTGKSTVCSYER